MNKQAVAFKVKRDKKHFIFYDDAMDFLKNMETQGRKPVMEHEHDGYRVLFDEPQ